MISISIIKYHQAKFGCKGINSSSDLETVFFFFLKNLFYDFIVPWKSQLQQFCHPTHSACWVYQCFHNPPNSDMDYGILNVHNVVFFCIYIHTEGLQFIVSSDGMQNLHIILTPGKLTCSWCIKPSIKIPIVWQVTTLICA